MRSKRSLGIRMASLGGAVALVGASLAGLVGLVATSNPAGADTPSFTVTCTIEGMTSIGPGDGGGVALIARARRLRFRQRAFLAHNLQ